MKIAKLRLKNFRCFDSLNCSFDQRLTVVVGANGAGKTSILDALALLLKSIASNMRNHSIFFSVQLSKNNFKLDAKENEIIIAIDFDELPNLTSKLVPKNMHESQFVDNKAFENSKDFFEFLYKQTLSKPLPILCYYPARRSLQYQSATADFEKSDAYKNAFDSNIDFSTTVAWFDAKDAAEARKRSNDRNLDYHDPVLSAVRKAVSKALGQNGVAYKYPHMDGTPPELYICHKDTGQNFKVTQLSDGYKAMLALVMDLARRMAQANSCYYEQNGGAVLESPAIVLIDEIELHLHPAWQQTVLPNLMGIFPNAQFIVTTHSPQILTSIPAASIKILTRNGVEDASHCTLGAESSRVLEEIFNVGTRPSFLFLKDDDRVPKFPLKEKIDQYFTFIGQGKYDSPEAIELGRSLRELIPDDPLFAKAEMQIERAKRLAKRKEANA